MYRPLAAVVLCAVALCACERRGDRTAADIASAATRGDVTYLTPPRVVAVSSVQGGYQIKGVASPDGRVRALTTRGEAFGATADKSGRFVMLAPRPAGPLLLTIAQENGGQATKAEGLLFVPPDGPAHAVILRPGAPALPLNPQAGLIATMDYDAGGGAAVGGVTAPNQMVQVSLDGATPVDAKSDAHGAFGARLSGERRITPGDHLIRVVSGRQSEEKHLTFVAPNPQLAGALLQADGWHVVWPLPGGGYQSTFVVAPQEHS
jgi:hypothetical protein